MIAEFRRWSAAVFLAAGLAVTGLGLAAGAAMAAEMRLMVLGDSLAAGYGLPPGQGFPERLERDLRADGRDVTVQNAGVSGDTTAAGAALVLVTHDPSLAERCARVLTIEDGRIVEDRASAHRAA